METIEDLLGKISESGYVWDIEEDNGKYLALKNCSIVLEDVENPGFVKEEAWERGCAQKNRVQSRNGKNSEGRKTDKGGWT